MRTKPKMYLMLGYPGAGKTTVAEMVSEITGAVHLNSDRFRLHLFPKPKFDEEEHRIVYAALDYMSELILASGKSVIYDANLNKYEYRKEKYEICARSGAVGQLVWVRTNSYTAKKRATVEADKNPDHRPFGNMDVAIFDRLVSEIEPPAAEENAIEISSSQLDIGNIKEKING